MEPTPEPTIHDVVANDLRRDFPNVSDERLAVAADIAVETLMGVAETGRADVNAAVSAGLQIQEVVAAQAPVYAE